jgi:hypothetical protein
MTMESGEKNLRIFGFQKDLAGPATTLSGLSIVKSRFDAASHSRNGLPQRHLVGLRPSKYGLDPGHAHAHRRRDAFGNVLSLGTVIQGSF